MAQHAMALHVYMPLGRAMWAIPTCCRARNAAASPPLSGCVACKARLRHGDITCTGVAQLGPRFDLVTRS